MSDRSRPVRTNATAHAARLILGAVLVVLITGPVTATASVSGSSVRPDGIVAQSTDPLGQDVAPRLQPVGNGDTIGSPAQPDDGGDPDRGTWWRILFGTALIVVVLVALIQRRQDPERARGIGPRRGNHPGDRNAAGR